MSVRASYGSGQSAPTDPIELALRPLSARVIAEMYRDDPFWEARFGDRGKRNANADGNFHAAYLAQALHMHAPAIMTRYARWLRDVLVARGMCSWHLEENFARLRVVVLATELPFAVAAGALLDDAMKALHHEEGAAAAVERLRPELEQAARNGRVLGSYIGDALAIGDPKHFIAHVQWRRAARAPSRESAVEIMASRVLDDVDGTLESLGRFFDARLEKPAAIAVKKLLAEAFAAGP